ncbi:sortase A [Lachnospiraceae bacterium XBB1006]|nr:sortase A [Lachnospiraceae bacterium XBB1006]
MKKRKIVAALLVGMGLLIMAVPFVLRYQGEQEAQALMQDFQKGVKRHAEAKEEPTTHRKTKDALLSRDNVIGIIEIKSIGICYPVMEGTTNAVLNAGIGHEADTVGIGEDGNCVLCGHNGSRYGAFFTPLAKVKVGDEVCVTDKKGKVHRYEIRTTKVVEPTDLSIKEQCEEEKLTLFTCANKGTKRFVCECSPVKEK